MVDEEGHRLKGCVSRAAIFRQRTRTAGSRGNRDGSNFARKYWQPWRLGRHSRCQTRLLTESVALADSYARDLRVSLTEAEQARAAESMFLANMSHELRNPLNGVVGLIENALVKNDLREVRANLTSALVATNHLTSVVDDVLTFKKIEGDSGDIVLKPCDVFGCTDFH